MIHQEVETDMLKHSTYHAANKRRLSLCVGVAILIAASAQQLGAADRNAVRKQIEDLSAPNEMTRANACNSLGDVNAKDADVAVDALLGVLGDVSGSVRLAAVMAMGKIGPNARKAVPNIIECYQRDTVAKAEVIRTLGRIGPESPEAIDFLIEVVRGGRSGSVRPLDGKNPPMALRREAIATLSKIGPNSKKCIPILLDVLNIAAADVTHHEQTFQATAEALSAIGVGDKRVMSTLKRFQQGKGFRAQSKGSQAMERSVITADSAVKRLEQAEKVSSAKQEKDK